MDAISHLAFLKSLPKYEQRSKEWFDQRSNRLTASDVATALGLNPYKKPIQLLFEKCGVEKKYESNKNTEHGQKYEDEAVKIYEKLMNRENHTFGMISFNEVDPVRAKRHTRKYIDKKYSFLGGSPDGILIDANPGPDTVLTQLEIKCPLQRRIKHGSIPDYYIPQIQLNMFILDLDVTDFCEYSPAFVRKNVEFNIVRIYRSEPWFDENFPKLYDFWSDVLAWRTRDITQHPEYFIYNKPEKIPIYRFIEDNTKMEVIVNVAGIAMDIVPEESMF
jgi:putative phage-type endonuclease